MRMNIHKGNTHEDRDIQEEAVYDNVINFGQDVLDCWKQSNGLKLGPEITDISEKEFVFIMMHAAIIHKALEVTTSFIPDSRRIPSPSSRPCLTLCVRAGPNIRLINKGCERYGPSQDTGDDEAGPGSPDCPAVAPTT